MEQYQYKYIISGEYKDWCEIYKGETLIHDGSLLGLVSIVEGERLLNLNYGTKQYFHSVLKSFDNFKIAVPKELDLSQSKYKYQPVIFDSKEFKEFVDKIYFNEKLLKNLPKVSKEDVINIWISTSPSRKNYSDISEMKKDILDNILFFSDDSWDVSHLNSLINASEFSINQIPDKHESVIVYLDSENGVFEWGSLIKIENRIYLKLDEKYYVK